jgi:hypothetical protein
VIIGLIIGFVAGVIAMYLFCRNSPNHFLKFKKFVDAVNEKMKDEVIGV